MPKRMQTYTVPFEVRELDYDEALAVAFDTGKIFGTGTALLETVVALLDELERPDEHVDCIQVAGTNGKTSTARFTAAILSGEGLKTGLYTSPQLVRFEERIEVAGSPVSSAALAHGVSVAVEAGRRLNERRVQAGEDPYGISPFDLLTVGAFVLFAEAQVDVAVLEVGLGGRWDATSAADPLAVAITGIGLDHMHILGNTLAEIAGEKAAVIKPGRAVVLGEGVHEPSVWRVMQERCAACDVDPVVVSHTTLKEPSFLGDAVEFETTMVRSTYRASMHKPSYQPQNAACAIALAEAYLGRELDGAALSKSLDACPTPGRFDVLRVDPLVLIDACHNPQSCENFVRALDEIDPRVDARPTLLIAALSDKDVSGIVDVLVPAFPRVVVTATSSERALPADKLAALIQPQSKVVATYATVEEAVAAFTASGTPFVAAGTITLAGEVAGLLR